MSRRTRRIDYWQDPNAPAPTSRKTSASVFVRNARGFLLVLKRVEPAELDDYPIHPALRARIHHGLTSAEPYVT